ncbi:MAG: sodium:solute symporter family protein [Candidatus Marinimicrobia bacterium]|jgi:SSS family solute:Na+ symporter|nr:sodium:solute symporter family protein [Candidatus Neomarinimicrobiota bacterium]MDP7654122.1 sodium:solute symporter family protein [Candidatus Neomarinimicrobiota bacterium]
MYPIATIDYIIIAVYLMGMVGVGLWFAKKHTNFDDFFLAGRSLTTPLLITTLISTYYGIDVLFGDSQLGFTDGVVAWFGYARPTYAFFIIAAFLLAQRLREEDFKSLPDILDKYYGKNTRYVGAVTSFTYSLPALSLYGFGMLGEVILGWEPVIGMLVLGGIALIYTLTGGFWAVALTDSIQFLFMCVVLALAVPFAMNFIGGFDKMIDMLEPSYFDTMGDLSIWLIIIYASTGLAILVEPTFYQRIFAAKSYKNVRNALIIGIFIWGSYDWIITIIAMAAKTGVIQGILPADVAPDAALLTVMVAALPAGALGLFMAGVLSTEMSTLDSYCLVAGGNVAYDIYKPAIKPDASDDELIKKTRYGILLSWVLGFAMAISFDQMLGLWVFMASILISSVMIPILLGLFVPSFRKPLAGLLSSGLGLLSTVILNIVIMTTGAFDPVEETYIVQWFGIDFLQEFVMYLTVPISLLGFFAGLGLDKGKRS